MREVVVNVRCERHPDRVAEEVTITVGGQTAKVDLCDECREPLVELVALGRPAVEDESGVRVPRFDRTLSGRIRNAQPGKIDSP